MNIIATSYRAYWQLQKNRKKKKSKLYKLAFGVALDKTIILYLGLFLIMGAFIAYDILQQYQGVWIILEKQISQYYFSVMLLLIMRGLSLSFIRPGVLFASGELLLSSLPFQRNHIWYLVAINKNLRLTIRLCLCVLLLKLLTPLSFSFLFVLVLFVVSTQWLIIIPQWILYRQSWLTKFCVITIGGFVISSFTFIVVLLSWQHYLPLIGFAGLLLLNIWLYPRIFKGVDWQTTAETNDKIIWNLFFVSRMSKVSIDPPKRKGLFHHFVRNRRLKRPFPSGQSTKIYQRLLFIYFIGQKEQLIKGTAGILLIMILMSLKDPHLFGIGMALSSFIYAQLVVSFFTGIFQDKLLFSLPWQIDEWQRSYLKWAYIMWGCFLVVAALLLFWLMENRFWIVLQISYYAMFMVELLRVLLHEKINQLTKSARTIPILVVLWIVFLFFGAIAIVSTPSLSVIVLLIWWIAMRKLSVHF